MNLAEKRILRDVNTVMKTNKDLLSSQGIYYLPNEQTMKQGIALLVGQSDTPYFGGYYFFDISFPDDYPFSPIKVRSLTQDGVTRFNPNMYREGKVCLSILNTWHDGPQWSGVQTLESVLLLLMSDVLCANPLANEPAYRACGKSEDALLYNRLLWHANVKTAIIGMMTKLPEDFAGFSDIVVAEFFKHSAEIRDKIVECLPHNGKTEHIRVFSFGCTYAFQSLLEKIDHLVAVKN